MVLHPSHGIALIRIGLGVEFLVWSCAKIQGGWLTTGRPLAQEIEAASQQAVGPYADFLTDAVLPNVALFAQLVTIGELGAGLSLALGLLTRLGALTGMWLVLNFTLMRGGMGVEASIDRIFFLGCITCLLTASGRVWGLDGRVRDFARAYRVRVLQIADRGVVGRRLLVPLMQLADKLQ